MVYDAQQARELMFEEQDDDNFNMAVSTAESPFDLYTPSEQVAACRTPSTVSSLLESGDDMSMEPADITSPPKLPVRIIDEDYDEGIDQTILHRLSVRHELSSGYGISERMGMEETLERIIENLPKRFSISGRRGSLTGGSLGSTASASFNFPPLQMPSLPTSYL